MKYNITFPILFLILIVFINGCDKEHEFGFQPNAVRTFEVSSVNQTSAVVSGEIVSNGGKTLTERGICWHTSPGSKINNNKKTNSPFTIGIFSSTIENLQPGTTYYVRAFATNTSGTAYGNELTFSTNPATIPILSSTKEVTNITQTTAVSGGVISNDGAAAITSKGVCWNTSANPTINNSRTNDGTGISTFNSNLTNLTPSTTYYVRAYATNSVGTAYGNQITFTTASLTLPTIQTNSITSITQTTATGGGNVTNNGGANVTSRGVCWSTTPNPTLSNSFIISGNGGGVFSSNLTGLNPGTTYFVRAFATNSVGTAYGNTVSFITSPATIPTGVQTNTVSSITQNTALCGGNVTGTGGSPITQRGVCWSNTTTTPTIANPRTNDGSGTGTFTSNISGLLPNTTYHVRAYATNSVGTAYGINRTFTTTGSTIPVVSSTTAVSGITFNSANSGGTISSNGGSEVISRGVCWSNTNSNPTIANSTTNNGTGVGTFSSSMTNMLPNSLYYVRAYATNSVGTGYGNVRTFTTLPSPVSVGQSFQGGIVGYIYQPGDIGYVAGQIRGIIVATTTQSTGAQWGCSGVSINGTSSNLASGLNNTNLIVNGCSTSNIAARICFNLTSGGFSDWVLPSHDELNRLYLNRSAIGGFLNTSYWSSTQATSTTARSINFSNGTSNNVTKTSLLYVRGIRYFQI
ncbi:hypothetical protein [Flavobacterium sp.]|uniref:hypothetical protein n=1 Tax=Flavobacterium sp. TaxID=239 RepID=UPI002FDA26D4